MMATAEFQTLPSRQPGLFGVIATTRRVYARHTHDEYGIGLIEAGAQRSLSGRGTVEAGPGAVIMVNPGEIHDGVPIGDGARRWRMVYLDVALVRDAWTDIAGAPPTGFEFARPALSDGPAAALLRALFQSQDDASPDGTAFSEQALFRLLARLGTRHPLAERAVPAALQAAKARIDADPAAPVSLTELAQDCGLSRFQTLRGFARATGFTPHAYILQRRLELARALIRQRLNLAEAALAAGFADQSHLNRVFTRCHGYTPGAYAKAFG
jgi:AraC-like DNA-binding protein